MLEGITYLAAVVENINWTLQPIFTCDATCNDVIMILIIPPPKLLTSFPPLAWRITSCSFCTLFQKCLKRNIKNKISNSILIANVIQSKSLRISCSAKCIHWKFRFYFQSGSLCFINVLTQKGHNFQGIRHAHFVPIRHSFQKSPQPP